MKYSIRQIASQIGARHQGEGETLIRWILTDSRSLSFPEETLFFALKTSRGDGHQYVSDLYHRGVRAFVVDHVLSDSLPGAHFLVVPNTLKALQRLAERHREEFQIPVIGITGSNGKTIAKEWLYQLLSPSKVVTRSPKSYNSQVGVPLSVMLLDESSEVGVFEAGISQVGEMEALGSIIQPTIGLFTHLGPAHQENFDSLAEKVSEKLKLFRSCQILVYPLDDTVVAEQVAHSAFDGRTFTWSFGQPAADVLVTRVEKEGDETRLTVRFQGQETILVIPFNNEIAVENFLGCLSVALLLDIPMTQIVAQAQKLEPVAMRLEVKEGRHGCLLINDSYNSDVQSLDIALDFMNRRPDRPNHHRTLILSDIYQMGLPLDKLYKEVANMAASRGVDKFIGIGPDVMRHADVFPMTHWVFPTVESFISSPIFASLRDEVILLKGARAFHFERLTNLLEMKVHETILEVNLSAVVENLNYYRSFMRPETKMVCMVKASAYGSGSVEVAKTLQDKGVDYLAVAVADEGVELRRAGITANIIIMNPEMTSFKTLFEYKLEPEVYNFRLLEALVKAAEREGITGFPVHVKLDTGMHRLGFDPQHDMETLIQRLHHQDAVLPRSVFSHFVGSDSDDFDAFSQRQFELFDAASQQLQAAFDHKILRHICNSAGIEHFQERHLDMVRLGLGLYGVNARNNQILHNVSTLKTTILQIRDVPADDTVGYSRRGHLTRPSRIAAIPIGYADGLNRHLGCGVGYCLVAGRKAPYVGNICMDVCMIDVTDIPCQEGDSVEIFGDNLPVTILSDLLQTIPYEILTGVSTRVKRVYFTE